MKSCQSGRWASQWAAMRPATKRDGAVRSRYRVYSAAAASRITDISPAEQSSASSSQLAQSLREVRRVLADDIGGPGEWTARVDASIRDLDIVRRPTIGDAFAAPEDVISAILQDPLVDGDDGTSRIRERREGRLQGPLRIAAGPSTSDQAGRTTGDVLLVQSSWLQEAGLDLVETPSVHDLVDLDLIVTDPYRLQLPASISGHGVIIVNGPLPPRVSQDDIRSRLNTHLPVLFVRSDLALHAIETLSRSARLPATSRERVDAVAVFQRDFLLSGIGSLKASIRKAMPRHGSFQWTTARSTAMSAVSYAQGVVRQDRETVRGVGKVISELERRSKQAVSRARHLSAVNRGLDGAVVEGGVQYSMSQAKAGLMALLEGRFSWLGLLGRARADDVGPELVGYVETSFGRDLEQTLTFESGQMAQLQEQLHTDTDKVIHRLSEMGTHHPFASKMLQNHLASLSLSTPTFAPDSLLQPIRTRRRQIQAECVPRLHRSAQRAVLTAFSTGFAGALASVLVYPQIPGATAAGLGILSIIGGIMLGQRMWYKAQGRFSRDFDRITRMLQGDLQAILEDALEARLLAKPTAAVEGLTELRKNREDKLIQLDIKLDELRKSIA